MIQGYRIGDSGVAMDIDRQRIAAVSTLQALGYIKLEGQKLDAKAWVLYLDGEEFARVERREDLPAVLGIEGPHGRGLVARMRALLRQ
jgi:hypothetical protein